MSDMRRRVGLFYGLAFGWVSLVAAGLWAIGADLSSPVASLAIAFLYMPAPLVAALVTERVTGQAVFGSFERIGWRRVPRVVLVATALTAAVFVAALLLTAILGNGAGVPGVGRLALAAGELRANLAASLPEGTAPSAMPPPVVLYVTAFVGAMAAGLTVNGLFAFGEEYGWRGFLMDELRGLGVVRANLLTGLLWGLWHAPLILMGFNYGTYRFLGIPAMCVFTSAFSFVLWYARERSGSVLAPAIVHGAFNGTAGLFLLAVRDGDRLVAVPAGLVGSLALALVSAGTVWLAQRSDDGQRGEAHQRARAVRR